MANLRDQPRTFTSGLVLSPGARCFFYLTGTLTPATIYASVSVRSGGVFVFGQPLPNPLTSDSAGRLPPIYLDPLVTYRMRMFDALGNLLHDLDPFVFIYGPESVTALDDSGAPLPFATLTLSLSRTHKVQGTFTANAAGVFADIALDPALTYRVVMKEASGRLVYDVDPYPGAGSIIVGGGQAARIPRFVTGKSDSSAAAIMTSDDGKNWSLQTTPAALACTGLAYSPTLRLLVCIGGTGVYTSPDGITWTARTTPNQFSQWTDVTWSPALGLFVAICSTATNNVITSPDGINWTARVTPLGTWQCVRWSPQLGLFAAGKLGGTGGFGDIQSVMTSPDGINWTIRNSQGQSAGFGFTFYKMAVDPSTGAFIASSRGEFGCMRSSNGTTWTFQPSGLGGSAHTDVEVNPAGIAVMTRVGGDHSFARSTNNGSTWANTVNGDYCEDIAWSADLGLFAGVCGANAPAGKKAIWSADGNTWTDGSTPAGANTFPSWDRVIYAAV